MKNSERLPGIADDLAPAVHARARNFAERSIRPHALSWDNLEQCPLSLFQEAGNAGLLGLRLPSEVGGEGLGWLDTAAYIEGLSYGLSGGAVMGLLAQSELTLPLLYEYGDASWRDRIVRSAIRGETILALALSEPRAGSDLSMVQCAASRSEADDVYIINGDKRWITNGGTADILILAARTGIGPHDLTLFACPRELGGVETIETIRKIGNMSANTAHLRLRSHCIPAAYRLGPENGGFRLAMRNFVGERLVMAIYVTACMARALEASLDYTRQRHAFGHAIIDFQVWKHRFADHLTTYLAARGIIRDALFSTKTGTIDTTLATAAKLFCTQNAIRVIDDCMQSFGAVGYTPECDVARMWRDVRLYTIGGGSSEIMREILSRPWTRENPK